MKIVADDKIPFLRGVLEDTCKVEYYPGAAITAEHVKDADALIVRTRTKCNAGLLAGSSVKIVATATIGYDHLDTEWLDSAGIKWTNAPGCNSSSVAQYITSILLNLAVKYNFELNGKTLGVIGVGNVGTKVAKCGEALGMKVLLNDPPRAEKEGNSAFVSLEELLAASDIVTVHVPLNRAGRFNTFHLAGDEFFGKMKADAFFINSSRGEVCDNAVLKEVLNAKKIRGATLDVWEGEPDIDLELLDLLEYGTPHIAGYSYDGKANGTAMSVQAVSRELGLDYLEWRPDNVPLPECTEIVLEDDEKLDKILLNAINNSYDISNDDRRLRNSPETFEKQRGDYPLRREFHLFDFTSEQKSPNANTALEALRQLRAVTAAFGAMKK